MNPRRIDALIAEKVFERDPKQARAGLHLNGDLEYHWGYPIGHAVALCYAESIEAAFQVVGQMSKHGYDLTLTVDSHCKKAEAYFHSYDSLSYGKGQSSETSLAICIAALKAFEVSAQEIEEALS